jgi:hypothetical protein
MAIAQLRQSVQRDIFDYQQLLDVLSNYRKPRDKITKMLADGSIIRIKKGLYCFGEAFRRGVLSRGYIANLIYGPSYVSLASALSFYSLIPERVETVTSVTTSRSRQFETPFGFFSYRHLSESRYTTGATINISENAKYMIASPEKALVDTIWLDRRFSGRTLSCFTAYLVDDLRVDMKALHQLDISRFFDIAHAYKSPKIRKFIRYLETQKGLTHA